MTGDKVLVLTMDDPCTIYDPVSISNNDPRVYLDGKGIYPIVYMQRSATTPEDKIGSFL